MNWSDYTTGLYNFLQVADPSGTAAFNLILPRIVDDAEQRMYRDPDLDFLVTRTTDRTQQTTPGSRNVLIPPAFIVVEDVALILPSGAQPTQLGATRVPLLRTTRQFIDVTWPDETQTQVPVPFETYWSIFSENQTGQAPPGPVAGVTQPSAIIIGPTPNGSYVTEYRGTFRPQPFYTAAMFAPTTGQAINPTATTFLSFYLPDLFFAASMVASSGYLRLFSAASDDPRMAISWEQHYQALKETAAVEEARKKSHGYQASSYGAPVLPQGSGAPLGAMPPGAQGAPAGGPAG